jgi:hypothetical protein
VGKIHGGYLFIIAAVAGDDAKKNHAWARFYLAVGEADRAAGAGDKKLSGTFV